jgi:F420 biosynthesis protein FbiB-like protein
MMPDGSPQVTPVWFSFDGHHILINTSEGRARSEYASDWGCGVHQDEFTLPVPADRGSVFDEGCGADGHQHGVNTAGHGYRRRAGLRPVQDRRAGACGIVTRTGLLLSAGASPPGGSRLAVPDDVIQRVLATACHAPRHTIQPWRFVVISMPESRSRLAETMGNVLRRDLQADRVESVEIESKIEASRERLESAPVAILLCVEQALIDEYADDRRRRAAAAMFTQSAACAGLQLLLAAHAEGLAGVWVCSPLFAPDAVKEALNLPPTWEPQAMYYIGYPAAHAPQKHVHSPAGLTQWQ